jgi:hypothetical protein
MTRALPLLAFATSAALAACAPAPAPAPARASCGVMAVRHVSGPRLDPSRPVPACALPEPEEIARACEAVRPAPSPYYPGLRAAEVSCRFTDRRRTRAACTFDLSERPAARGAPQPRPERIRESFVHRYDEVHEADASGYGTFWIPAGRCGTPG